MYETPFKSDNPSLDMTLSWRNHNLWTKNAKNGQNGQFSLFFFIPTLPPENGSLMAIESGKIYEMPYKSGNPSFGMILSWRNHNLWTKNAKNDQNGKFSLFLTYITPWK